MKTSINLTEGPILRGLVLFAIPLMLSNLFQQLYNTVDSVVVGQFAQAGSLAAVGGTGALVNLMVGFFLGISTGTGVLYAMHYGANDKQGLRNITNGALLLSLACGAVITVFAIGFAPQLLRLMDTPEDVIDLAVRYFRGLMVGVIPMLLYNVGAGMIRAGGDSAKPLLYLFVSGAVNVGLDLLFVAAFDWGIAGAAAATVLSQFVSAVLVLVHLARLPQDYRLRPLHLGTTRVTLWDIARISFPCGLQSAMFNISNLLVQTKINSFGSVAMAGVTAYTKLDGFVYMPIWALSFAVSTYVGQNIGAGRYDRVRKGVRVCVTLGVICTLVVDAVIILCHNSLLGLFTEVESEQAYAVQMMWFLVSLEWVYVFSDVLGGAMRGAGQAVKVTCVSACCICLFRIVWLSVALLVVNDISTVFICYPLSWLLSTVVMTICYFKSSVIRRCKSQSAAV